MISNTEESFRRFSDVQNNNKNIRRYKVVGSQRLSNYWWAIVISLGALGFLVAGISSYLQKDLIPLIQSKNIVFFPQGLVMSFYGILGIVFSSYLWFTLIWGIGGGFNEFNKKLGFVRIFRWGFPGKNRRIDFSYNIQDIEAIRVELQEGINPRRTIYMKIKGGRDIQLTRIGQPLTLEDIETQASELAQFLQVSLERV
jgi:hypothetical protein